MTRMATHMVRFGTLALAAAWSLACPLLAAQPYRIVELSPGPVEAGFGDVETYTDDGRHLCFVPIQTDNARPLYCSPSNPGEPATLVFNAFGAYNGVLNLWYTADTRRVLFLAPDLGARELFVHRFGQSGYQKVTPDATAPTDFVGSVQRGPGKDEILVSMLRDGQWRLESFDPRQPKQVITTFTGGQHFTDIRGVRISPDGQRIAFLGRRDGNVRHELFSVRNDGTDFRLASIPGLELVSGKGPFVSFHPDSQSLIYRGNGLAPGRSDLFQVPVAGGSAIRLNDSSTVGEIARVRMSDDGAHIAYQQYIAGSYYLLHANSGEAESATQVGISVPEGVSGPEGDIQFLEGTSSLLIWTSDDIYSPLRSLRLEPTPLARVITGADQDVKDCRQVPETARLVCTLRDQSGPTTQSLVAIDPRDGGIEVLHPNEDAEQDKTFVGYAAGAGRYVFSFDVNPLPGVERQLFSIAPGSTSPIQRTGAAFSLGIKHDSVAHVAIAANGRDVYYIDTQALLDGTSRHQIRRVPADAGTPTVVHSITWPQGQSLPSVIKLAPNPVFNDRLTFQTFTAAPARQLYAAFAGPASALFQNGFEP